MTAINPIPIRMPARSMGLKLLLVCVLALMMAIPAMFVFFILNDRTERARDVTQEIGRLVGGPQNFAGPMLAVPYVQPVTNSEGKTVEEAGTFIIFPVIADAQAVTQTSERRRGLFKTPVWTADLSLKSSFDLTGVEARLPVNATMAWDRAELITGVHRARGARSDLSLTVDGKSQPMSLTRLSSTLSAPVTGDTDQAYAGRGGEVDSGLQMFGAPVSVAVQPGARFDAVATLKFSGAESLAVLAYGQTTRFSASGDWPGPSYSGAFARDGETGDEASANGGAKGYAARWSVPFVARGVPSDGEADVLNRLGATAMRVSFVEAANPYQAVSRSLKYAPMFLGLVFLAYFMFETTQKKRIHPAQYVLIGLAQLIFYLLLLAVAERVGFDIGFAVAAGATVALISAYAGWVFEKRRQGFIALAAFTALYGLIYVLMRLQDWALLVGAGTSFAAIATVMYCTRNIDWYGGASTEVRPAAEDKA